MDVERHARRHDQRIEAERLQIRSAEIDEFRPPGSLSGSLVVVPGDNVPRVISSDEWARLERGLAQRVSEINAFLCDISGRREIQIGRASCRERVCEYV